MNMQARRITTFVELSFLVFGYVTNVVECQVNKKNKLLFLYTKVVEEFVSAQIC